MSFNNDFGGFGSSDSPTGFGSEHGKPNQAVTSSSYAHGNVQSDREWAPSFKATSARYAPVWLWVSTALYSIVAGWLGYLVTKIIANTGQGEDTPWLRICLHVIPILAIAVFCVVMLKAQPWGRYALTLISALMMFVIVINGYWPVTLIALVALIPMWMPQNNSWFGFR